MSSALDGDAGDDLQPQIDGDAVLLILTSGAPIRAWATIAAQTVDEARLHVTDDGLRITANDPANVVMVDYEFHAEGFKRYELDGDKFVFGLDLDQFTSTIDWARKRGDGDPVSIDVFEDPTRMRVSVTRPDQGMKRVTEWFGIDPEGIRPEPEVPDLDLPNKADPQPRALHEGIDVIDEDIAWVTRDGQKLVIATTDGSHSLDGKQLVDDEPDVTDTVYFPNCAWSEDEGGDGASTLFSMDYLESVTAGVKQAKMDHVTVHWDEEFPVRFAFEQSDWGISGQYMLAPRLQSDD